MARDSSTDLRSRVGELEATVSGLTQELVEADERIRQLEAALEDDARETATDAAQPDGGPADGHKTDTASETASSEDGSGDGELDDIIVA